MLKRIKRIKKTASQNCTDRTRMLKYSLVKWFNFRICLRYLLYTYCISLTHVRSDIAFICLLTAPHLHASLINIH